MSFELFQKRLKQRGVTNDEALTNLKEKSFNDALQRAYNSEIVLHKDGEHRVIINANKQKIEYDEKIISAPNLMGLHPGSTLYLPRTKTHWIVLTEHLGEKAYFKGDIKKAIYEISWRDDKDIRHSHWAAVRGPSETKIKSDPVKGVANDVANHSLVIWIGQTDGTEALKRYTFLMVAGKVWKVTTIDDVSQPGLVILHLIEAISNPQVDNKPQQIARDDKIEVTSIFNTITQFKAQESISVNPNLYINGKLVSEKHKSNFRISTDCAEGEYSIVNDTITFNTPGDYSVSVGYDDVEAFVSYKISIKAQESEVQSAVFTIEGNTRIRPVGNITEHYTIEYYVNGTLVDNPYSGHWEIDSLYASIVEQTTDSVTLKFTSVVGKTELRYIYNNQVLAKHGINIVSVFG